MDKERLTPMTVSALIARLQSVLDNSGDMTVCCEQADRTVPVGMVELDTTDAPAGIPILRIRGTDG